MIQPPSKRYYTTFFDSDRWLRFQSRPDDVIVATPYKAGTTWTQNIVLHLIHQDLQNRNIGGISPWLDIRFRAFDGEDGINAMLSAQDHRRVIKTHLYFDGLPFDSSLKYIFVGRDPRDVFMSMWNFYNSFGDMYFETPDDPAIPALPRPVDDILEGWDNWIGQGAATGETDGYPFWSIFAQTKTWWDQRHRPNILFLHYADMWTDLKSQVQRVAEFIEVDVDEEMLDRITELCTFSSMQKNSAKIDENSESNLKGGSKSFFHKGGGGRWRGLLNEERLAKYEEVASRGVSPECRHWLEKGGPLV